MVDRKRMTQPFDRLKELLIGAAHTEVECGKILAAEFPEVLLPWDEAIVLVDTEYSTESGRTDIVVIADRTTIDGKERRAYVWELKAPQVWLFEKETEGRAKPSNEPYSAETQLLHYQSSLAGSTEFCARWKICRKEHVCIGGIVIGTTATLIGGSKTEQS
jgi:hypothetical protein